MSQLGAGTTTLSGASTYSGLTTVAAGTLQAGAVNAFSAASSYAVAATLDLNGFAQAIGSLSGAGQIDLGSASLTTGGDNGSTLFSGAIAGTGGLIKAGTGTFTLTGANTYGGGTTIGGGVLQMGNGGTTGSIAGNVADNGAFAIDRADDLVFAGVISGSGALVKNGAGRLALTANDSYAGGTTIGGGTLVMGNGGTTGAIAGDVVDNGAFAVNRSDDVTFAGAIGGSGSFAKFANDTLILTGNSTYTGGTTIAGGTLQLGSGGTSGAIVGDVVDNGALTVDRSDTLTLAGAISGAGGLNQVGSGMTVLSGVSTYGGPSVVTAGILDVDGSIANSAVTLNGGTLKGNGIIGALTVLSGSNVAPGNSIGTLSVAGNIGFAAGTTYQVELNAAGQADRINAGGTAILMGGTVQVAAAPGNYAMQTTYRILSAAGGVAGQFAGATVDIPFFNVSLLYTSTAVDLVLSAKTIDFSTFALTPNEKAASVAVNKGGFNTDLYKAFLNQPSTAFIPAALDALSGEIHPTIRTALIEDSRNAREAILDRLREADSGAPALAGGLAGAREMSDRAAMWVRVFTNWGSADTDGNAAAMGQSFSGIMTGADLRVADTLHLGVAGGYTHDSLSVKARSSRATSGDGHIGGYAGWTGGPVALRAGVEYAWGGATVTRVVQFPGFLDNTFDKQSQHSTQAFAEAGYAAQLGRFAFEPFVSAAWVDAGTGAFAERGGIAALNGESKDSAVAYTDVGVRLATDPIGGDAFGITPRAMLAWQHAFGTVLPGQSVEFGSTSQSFLVLGVPLDRDAIAADIGLDIELTPEGHLGLGYQGVLSNRVQSHAARADFTWNF
ncbi:MAG: autotransporter domain-containing protein [Rhizomicrobium sp.]